MCCVSTTLYDVLEEKERSTPRGFSESKSDAGEERDYWSSTSTEQNSVWASQHFHLSHSQTWQRLLSLSFYFLFPFFLDWHKCLSEFQLGSLPTFSFYVRFSRNTRLVHTATSLSPVVTIIPVLLYSTGTLYILVRFPLYRIMLHFGFPVRQCCI